jgi:hypothetical protein
MAIRLRFIVLFAPVEYYVTQVELNIRFFDEPNFNFSF